MVEAKRHTFGEVVEEHLTAMGPLWRNAKHRDQWAMTLRVYGEPLKGMPVADISTADVLMVLRPI